MRRLMIANSIVHRTHRTCQVIAEFAIVLSTGSKFSVFAHLFAYKLSLSNTNKDQSNLVKRGIAIPCFDSPGGSSSLQLRAVAEGSTHKSLHWTPQV